MPKNVDKNLNQPVTKRDLLELEIRVDLKIEKNSTKIGQQITDLSNQTLTGFDKTFTMLQKFDQERLFQNSRITRLEDKVFGKKI